MHDTRAWGNSVMVRRKRILFEVRTKIVATVGPACAGEEGLLKLAEAGVDVFRINTAHGTSQEHDEAFDAIRRVSRRIGRPLGILVDLAGPKIRLGQLPNDEVHLREGEIVRFVRGETSSDEHTLVTNYPKLIDELTVGDRIMLADGTASLIVESLETDAAVCRVVQPGTVRSRQGVNLPGVKISLPSMTPADQKYAAWAADRGADFIGLSFVRTAGDVHTLAAFLHTHRNPPAVIAKIEKPEAVEQLEAIVDAADGLMVARGDLGVEIDPAEVPVVQKRIIGTAHQHQKPVITATQMLDSMQWNPRPTRAETTDVANAILDGSDACMLSGETAIGQYPCEAVEMMGRIARATEPLLATTRRLAEPAILPEGLKPVTHAVVRAAGDLARNLDARMIIVASRTGATALALSKRRNLVPTVGVSSSEATLRRMCLMWGVVPLAGAPIDQAGELPKFIEQWGREQGFVQPGDRLIVLEGSGLLPSGHNQVLIHEVP